MIHKSVFLGHHRYHLCKKTPEPDIDVAGVWGLGGKGSEVDKKQVDGTLESAEVYVENTDGNMRKPRKHHENLADLILGTDLIILT